MAFLPRLWNQENRTIKGYHILGTRRLTMDEFYIGIAERVAYRSTCLSRINGVVIARNDRMISYGYNGWPSGERNCIEVFAIPDNPCERLSIGKSTGEGYAKDICKAIHAEINAIEWANELGLNIEGGTIYLFTESTKENGKHYEYGLCRGCTKAVVEAGIVRAVIGSVVNRGYSMDDTKMWEFFRDELIENYYKMGGTEKL